MYSITSYDLWNKKTLTNAKESLEQFLESDRYKTANYPGIGLTLVEYIVFGKYL